MSKLQTRFSRSSVVSLGLMIIFTGSFDKATTEFATVNTVVPRFDEPFGQEMHAEPPQEFHTVEGDGFGGTIVPVIFHLESHLLIGYLQDALVADAHPVHILAQRNVTNHTKKSVSVKMFHNIELYAIFVC